jgi:hypothetical protein
MEDARQVAVGGYKAVPEDGPDRCDSESDSENSDHGEEISYRSAYTSEMLDAEGKPKNGGPKRFSEEQVRVQRAPAAHRSQSQAEPTTQAQKAAGSCRPTIAAPTLSRPPDPLVPEATPVDSPKVPKKKSPAKKATKGRAGGQETEEARGEMDTRATKRRPSNASPRETLFDGATE